MVLKNYTIVYYIKVLTFVLYVIYVNIGYILIFAYIIFWLNYLKNAVISLLTGKHKNSKVNDYVLKCDTRIYISTIFFLVRTKEEVDIAYNYMLQIINFTPGPGARHPEHPQGLPVVRELPVQNTNYIHIEEFNKMRYFCAPKNIKYADLRLNHTLYEVNPALENMEEATEIFYNAVNNLDSFYGYPMEKCLELTKLIPFTKLEALAEKKKEFIGMSDNGENVMYQYLNAAAEKAFSCAENLMKIRNFNQDIIRELIFNSIINQMQKNAYMHLNKIAGIPVHRLPDTLPMARPSYTIHYFDLTSIKEVTIKEHYLDLGQDIIDFDINCLGFKFIVKEIGKAIIGFF